ncbi:MAG TPA: type II toxin-antitoxin system VapB family antitoxin [Solirubrobacterales bacterium]|nr:type II toxin-antitoxin system VapB family antitoxin [Solirubrobacterales bacterium]
MALNIGDKETEKLAREVAEITGESPTGAVREALRERKGRLETRAKRDREPGHLKRFLEAEIWPLIPAEDRGRPSRPKEEIEKILGYGEDGF